MLLFLVFHCPFKVLNFALPLIPLIMLVYLPAGYLHVTLLVYTGLRDPVWKIGQCLNQDIPHLLLQARSSGYVYKHTCIPPKTGFKGFLIHDSAGEQLLL